MEHAKYTNYVKKKINAYIKESTFEIPSIDARPKVSMVTVMEIARDYGYGFLYLNCSLDIKTAEGDLRQTKNELINNRNKKHIVFFNHYDEGSFGGGHKSLIHQVDDLIKQNSGNSNIKFILGKNLGEFTEHSELGSKAFGFNCICDGFTLLHLGCTCKRKGRKY
jgi:hypothetical protein